MRNCTLQYVLLILFLFYQSAVIYPQWHAQNIKPNVGKIYSLCFTDSLTGWGVGENFIKTTDGGKTWNILKYLGNRNYANIYTGFSNVSNKYLWVAGCEMKPMRSVDGGKVWDTLPIPSYQKFTSISFISKDTGFAIGQNQYNDPCIVYKSVDGGLNWDLNYTVPSNNLCYFIKFVDSKTGYLSGFNSFCKTTNGGLSWDTLRPDIKCDNLFLNNYCFIDDKLGFLCGYLTNNEPPDYGEVTLKTTNGGKHWIDIGKNFISMAFVNSKIGYGCGYDGLVSRTTDGGDTWIDLNTNVKSDLLSLYVFDKENVIILGGPEADKKETVIKTTNSGVSWPRYDSGRLFYFNSIKFINSKIGWGAGGGGQIFKTTDGGDNWQLQRQGNPDQTIVTGFILNNQYGWYLCTDKKVTGEIILATTNGGAVWDSVFTIPYSLYSIFFIDSKTGYACGTGGRIFMTSNGGKTWKLQKTDVTFQSLTKIYFINPKQGWAVGDKAFMIKTTDGGENWATCFSSWGRYYDVYFADSLYGFIAGIIDYSTIPLCKTSDGGKSWRYIRFNEDTWFDKFFFPTLKTGYGYSNYGALYKTIDSGYTWKLLSLPGNPSTNTLYFADDMTGWVATSSGVIYKTYTGGEDTTLLGIKNKLNATYDFSLYQNFPNPFNPSTVIKFSLNKSAKVKLVLYNILGDEIKIVADEFMNPGEHQVNLDMKGMSSGVYFYSLCCGENIQTKKLVFVK